MSIDSTHPTYDKYINKYTKCRNAYDGEEAVKGQTTKYLPTLEGIKATDPKYKSYLARAMFFGATRRTVDGLAGIIDRKPPVVNISDGLPWGNDIDGNGISLQTFASNVVTEAVLIGWQGVLVDMRDGYNYPYPVHYRAEQIINYKYDGNDLVMVMLCEEVIEVKDGYEMESIKQWRELAIENGLYIVILHRKNDKDEFYVHDFYEPTMRGAALTSIPFVFISTNNQQENPALLDMVNVNFHHYKNSADYEHGLHFTGLPTPYITGLGQTTDDQGNNIPIVLGSETCILIEDAGGSAGFLEFGGQGLGALATAMDDKKQEMASLGASLLQTDKKAAEAAETARINKSGDSNVIARIVSGAERGINNVLEIMSEWESINPEANTVELNRDFVDEGMDAQTITALVGAWQAGGISKETLVYNFQKKDFLEDNRTIEEEIDAIGTAAPTLSSDI